MKTTLHFLARRARPAAALSAALIAMLTVQLAQAQIPPQQPCFATPGWSAPIDLGTALRDDLPAAVAAAENGEAMVVWYGASGGGLALQSRRYARLQNAFRPTWQPAVAAAPLKPGADLAGPSASMDAAGNALAGWETGNQRVEVGRFARNANGSGQWGPPTVLSSASSFARAPVVTLRSDGKVGLALWQTIEVNGRRALHWASFNTASNAWTPESTPLAVNADEDLAPAVAFTADGYALLAYQYVVTATTTRRVRVFGQWFDPSTSTWSRASTLGDATYGTVANWLPPLVPMPRVTLDGNGQGLAVWRHRDPLGPCEEVFAMDFDGASKTWSTVVQRLSGCIAPLPGSPLPATSNVLGATIAPLNARTTFVLFSKNNALGASPQARRRANAAAPWDLRMQLPQPVLASAIGDTALAGSSDPSALWVQPRGTGTNSGHGLYASNYSSAANGCPAQWGGPQHIADISRSDPRLRTPERAAVPIAVWVDPVGETPHVYATLRLSNILLGAQ